MKTVCMLLQNHYDDDVRVRRKAEALVAAGYSVDVIALRADTSPSREYQINGVNVYTFALGKKRGSLLRYLFEYTAFFLLTFYKLTVRTRKRHYSMVDVNNLPDFLVFAAVWAKHRGAKVVLDMHEITPEFYISKYGIGENSPLIRFLQFIERRSMHFADHVLTISEPIQQLLVDRGLSPRHATVIMNSVDESLFTSVRWQPAAISSAGGARPFVMMYHGTLTGLYGLSIAIQAFALAKDQMEGAEFWILGSGPVTSGLERLAREVGLNARVKFLGKVPPAEIPPWLAQCDIGVLATRRDIFLDFSFSNKLPEYIIMNKAVISSRLKTIQHYFSEEALAYFEPGDVDGLAKQMVRLYGDAQLRASLASKAADEYKPIRWEIMKERYLQLIASLVTGAPSSKGKQQPEAFANAG